MDFVFKKFRKYACRAVLIISVLLIAINIVTYLVTGKMCLFGYKPMIVMTGSMEPTLRVNQFIIGESVSASDIQVGDIVAYRKPVIGGISEIVVHRVVGISDGGFVFKGDNNSEADAALVMPEQIMYRIIAR